MDREKFDKLSEEDLINRRKEIQGELYSARMKVRTGQFKRTSEFSRLRKEVARINTIIRERQLKQQAEGAAS